MEVRSIIKGDRIEIVTRCPVCGKETTIECSTDGYFNYRKGMVIQAALPELSPEKREALISGLCAKCWDEIPEED